MPWMKSCFPSLQIGCLAAYARQKGHDIKARHFHLKMATLLGLDTYDEISNLEYYINELVFASLLFAEKKKSIARYLRPYIRNVTPCLRRVLRVIDLIYRDVDWKDYRLVGFTITPSQLFASLLFAQWIKRDSPQIKILFGGPGVVGQLGVSVLNCFPQVDWCIDGEGEEAFDQLLKCLSKGIANVENFVPGLIYRRNNIARINPRHQLSSLKGLPDPDYDDYFELINATPYLKRKRLEINLPMEASRGCPYKCTFCGEKYLFTGYRARPCYEVVTQIARISKRYDCKHIVFVDSIILPSQAERLFPGIEKLHSDYYIFCQIRPGLTKKQLESMRRAGVGGVQIGIEALSTNLLRKMNKGTRFIDNLQIMKFCEEIGIIHAAQLIVGFPSETQRDVDESVKNIDYAAAFQPMTISQFLLLYGSPICTRPKSYGLFNVRNILSYTGLLHGPIAKSISFVQKRYDSQRTRRDYTIFVRRLHQWRHDYDRAKKENRHVLSYHDDGIRLCISDRRCGESMIYLDGEARALYLYCESIRNVDEIRKRFPDWSREGMLTTLNKLVKLKVMFREDGDYLSLAIRNNNELAHLLNGHFFSKRSHI